MKALFTIFLLLPLLAFGDDKKYMITGVAVVGGDTNKVVTSVSPSKAVTVSTPSTAKVVQKKKRQPVPPPPLTDTSVSSGHTSSQSVTTSAPHSYTVYVPDRNYRAVLSQARARQYSQQPMIGGHVGGYNYDGGHRYRTYYVEQNFSANVNGAGIYNSGFVGQRQSPNWWK